MAASLPHASVFTYAKGTAGRNCVQRTKFVAWDPARDNAMTTVMSMLLYNLFAARSGQERVRFYRFGNIDIEGVFDSDYQMKDGDLPHGQDLAFDIKAEDLDREGRRVLREFYERAFRTEVLRPA